MAGACNPRRPVPAPLPRREETTARYQQLVHLQSLDRHDGRPLLRPLAVEPDRGRNPDVRLAIGGLQMAEDLWCHQVCFGAPGPRPVDNAHFSFVW